MYLTGFVGKVVLVNVKADFVGSNRVFFQHHGQRLYARLRGVDHIGIWIEHHKWKTTPAGAATEEHKVHFLIPWHELVSVGAFPDRAFVESFAGEPETPTIGFNVRTSDDS